MEEKLSVTALLADLLNMAEAMLVSGSEITRVEDTITRILTSQGAERVEIAHPDHLTLTEQRGDFYGYTGDADQTVILRPGTFLVVFPGDAHRLRIPVNQPGEAFTRVVLKIKAYD